MALPNVVFVREERLNNGQVDLYAFKGAADAVDDDGPTIVGTYKLVAKNTIRKVIKKTPR